MLKTSTPSFFLVLTLALVTVVRGDNATAITSQIVAAATSDGIDLSVLNFVDAALASIATTYVAANITDPSTARKRDEYRPRRSLNPTKSIIDVHTHVVPDWYRALVPTTGGNPTPAWDMTTYLQYQASNAISHSIFSYSSPGANVYMGTANKGLTVAIARLMNEQAAAYVRANPSQLSFFAAIPLPYTAEAITEAMYALDTLGAVGLTVFSNHEGLYLGNAQFKAFFQALNARKASPILFVHPSTPYIIVDGKYIEANPTLYATGRFEFFFETARTFEDLTLTQTIHNFTNIRYIVPHVGGAFPSIIDRLLKSVPTLYDASLAIFQTRFFWDSAGPTYFHQVAGLLGYNIPTSQLVTGTDYPYNGAPIAPALAAIQSSTLVTAAAKTSINLGNAKALFSGLISF